MSEKDFAVEEQLSSVLSLPEKCVSTPSCSLRNSLASSLDFWKSIGACEFILKTIESGYVIPFVDNVPNCHLKNNQSALQHKDFVSSEIAKLLKNNFIHVSNKKPFVVSPLSVASNAKKLRLVLDLSRTLNPHVRYSRFRLEDARTFLSLLPEEGGYMIKFDLKSGYHHCQISQNQHKYLGFEWEGVFYEFECLCFGLASAPYIFTKLLRPLVKKWRAQGFRVVLYLDDGILICRTYGAGVAAAAIIREDLRQAGFFVTEPKCVWCPTPRLDWLGLLFDLQRRTMAVIPSRVSSCLQLIDELLEGRLRMSARRLASAVGKVISMGLVLGSSAQMYTRYAYQDIFNRLCWDATMCLSENTREELIFWKHNLERLSVTPLLLDIKGETLAFSDASVTGGGAFVAIDKQNMSQFVIGQKKRDKQAQLFGN